MLLFRYQATGSRLESLQLPAEERLHLSSKVVVSPARAAYSHSASVGRR